MTLNSFCCVLPFQSHLRHLFLSISLPKFNKAHTISNPHHKTTAVGAADDDDDADGGGGGGVDERQRYFHLFNDRLLLLRFSANMARVFLRCLNPFRCDFMRKFFEPKK